MSSSKIIIIGAGAAGIACASKLIKYGFQNVTILEAETRIGGRINTITFGDNVVDLGAEWCHGEKNNVIYELVQNLNLIESSGDMHENYQLIRSNGEILNEKLTERLLEIFDEIVKQQNLKEHEKSETASNFLRKEFENLLNLTKNKDIDRKIAAEFLENLKKIENSSEGCDNLSEMSASGNEEYEECAGNQLLNWKGKGYKTILELLMNKKATDDGFGILNACIKFGKTVKKINWQRDDSKVLIICNDGEQFEADHVIVTVSLGVLKAQHKVLFEPQLSLDKVAAIENINFGTVNKIFIEFAEKFWPDNWPGFAMLWREEDLREIRSTKHAWLEDVSGFFGVSYQPRVLGGWIAGANARHIETFDETEIKNASLEILRRFLPCHIPEPVNFIVTAWSTNPNFRGSYSYHSLKTAAKAVSVKALSSPLMVGESLRVQFAGEATNTKHYSTVHGAIETGWREAERLAVYYDKLDERKGDLKCYLEI